MTVEYEPRHLCRLSTTMNEARIKVRARRAAGLPGLWDYRGSPDHVGRHRVEVLPVLSPWVDPQ